MTAITIENDTLNITFSAWGLDSYRTFLKTKKLPESRIAYDPGRNAYTVSAPARLVSV